MKVISKHNMLKELENEIKLYFNNKLEYHYYKRIYKIGYNLEGWEKIEMFFETTKKDKHKLLYVVGTKIVRIMVLYCPDKKNNLLVKCFFELL